MRFATHHIAKQAGYVAPGFLLSICDRKIMPLIAQGNLTVGGIQLLGLFSVPDEVMLIFPEYAVQGEFNRLFGYHYYYWFLTVSGVVRAMNVSDRPIWHSTTYIRKPPTFGTTDLATLFNPKVLPLAWEVHSFG